MTKNHPTKALLTAWGLRSCVELSVEGLVKVNSGEGKLLLDSV